MLLAILAAKKKYKPVAKKIQLVITDLPEHFHIVIGRGIQNPPGFRVRVYRVRVGLIVQSPD